MKDTQVGNSDFDESFLVRGDDEMMVRKLLDPAIQEGVLELEDRYPAI